MPRDRTSALILLAIAIAVAGLRPAPCVTHAHDDHGVHTHVGHAVHYHEHGCGDVGHGHDHHGQPGETRERGGGHHHEGIDLPEVAPKSRWAAAHRVQIDGPPVAPLAAALLAPVPLPHARHARSGKPPPAGSPPPGLSSIRTTVLRL